MNIKKNLIILKLLLLTIICGVVCIAPSILFMDLNTITNNYQAKINSETNIPLHTYATLDINKSAFTRSFPPSDNRVYTLSRGYVEKSNKNLETKIASSTYDDDFYSLNEIAIINYYNIKKTSIPLISISPSEVLVINPHLPEYLMYKNVHITDLKEFLKSKDSLLAEEPYFSTILSVSKDFNLNPLVMFAITGQEQSFVPKNNKNSYKIANNPFNVFNSWEKYNTNIQDSCSIAARTIVNLCKNKPDNTDAFAWINLKYSEDQNWSKAVRSILKQLEDNVSYWK
jgi:hypothetical protein